MSWHDNFVVRFLVRVLSPLLRALGLLPKSVKSTWLRTDGIASIKLSTVGVVYVEMPQEPLTAGQRAEIRDELRRTADYIAECARDHVLDKPCDLGWAYAVHLDSGGDLSVNTPGADERPGGKRLPYMTRWQVIEVIDELRGLALAIETS